MLLPLTFWPGSLLLGAAAVFAWRERSDPAVRFLVAWVVPFWFVLELVPTKLPNYLLPVFPALALLAGRAAIDARASLPAWARRAVAIVWAAASLGVAALLASAPLGLGQKIDAVSLVAAVAIVLVGALATHSLWRAVTPGLAARAAVLALIAFPALAHQAPMLDPLWLSRNAAALVARAAPPGTPIAVVGYDEPSLVFLLGTKTMIAAPQQAAQRLATAKGALALVESRADDAFRAAARDAGVKAEELGQVEGIDYSNGKRMVIALYRSAPG